MKYLGFKSGKIMDTKEEAAEARECCQQITDAELEVFKEDHFELESRRAILQIRCLACAAAGGNEFCKGGG